MRVSNNELKKIVRTKNVPFDERVLEKEPYLEKQAKNGVVLKYNDSLVVRKAYMDGRMKDFRYKGLEVLKGARQKLGYHITKINQYVESRDFLDDKGGEMKIITIYKVYSNKYKPSGSFYVACENVIIFPTLERLDIVGKNRNISLSPYIWEVKIYAFDTYDELVIWTPEMEDTIYFMQIQERNIEVAIDAKLVLENFTICFTDENIVCNIAGERKKLESILKNF